MKFFEIFKIYVNYIGLEQKVQKNSSSLYFFTNSGYLYIDKNYVMYIDISTKELKEKVFNLFDGFSSKKEIYEYYGVCSNTSNLKYINNIAKEIGFDFSVYKKRRSPDRFCLQCGKKLKPGQKKFCSSSCAASFNNKNRTVSDETKAKISEKLRKPTKECRVRKGKELKHYKLKEQLFSSGLKEYRCEKCGITEWMGEKITLQLHHIDGNRNNNNMENLQILCPNCHSQTDTFCGKNVKGIQGDVLCKKCGRKLYYRNVLGLCLNCYKEYIRKDDNKPTKEELEKDFNVLRTYAALARKYDVGPNIIKRWLKDYNIF